MYKRIESQLVLNGISKKELTEQVGIAYNILLAKMRGEREFTLKEAHEIKQILHSEEPIEELFLLSA